METHVWARQQNLFECGCLDVSFESKGEKGRREEREKQRATWRTMMDGWCKFGRRLAGI